MSDEKGFLGLSGRWVKRLLGISLVLNFLLIGVAIGVGMKATPKKWRGATNYFTAQVIQLTGEDRREEVRGILAAPIAERQERRAIRAKRWNEIIAAIRITPFDQATLITAFSDGRTQAMVLRSQSEEGLTRAIARMTDAERKMLADRVAAFHEERNRARR